MLTAMPAPVRYPGIAADRPGWRMFSVTPSNNLLFVPPVVAGSLHSDPVEEVSYLRDEVANLVWAVERLVPSVAGGVTDREAMHRVQPPGGPPQPGPPVPDEALDYLLATTVPEHWNPFRPVGPTGQLGSGCGGPPCCTTAAAGRCWPARRDACWNPGSPTSACSRRRSRRAGSG